jgi:hypothetical protein
MECYLRTIYTLGMACDLSPMILSRIKLDACGQLKEEVVWPSRDAKKELGKLLVMPRRKRTRRVRLTQPCRILAFRRG